MLTGRLELDMRERLTLITAIALLGGGLTPTETQVRAQLQIRGNVIIQNNVIVQKNRGGGDPSENRTHIGVDSNFSRIQKRFDEYIEGEKYSDAVPLFSRLANYDADFFVDIESATSIKNQLDQTFIALPAKFKNIYELTYGGEARFLVEEFQRTRNRQFLADAYRQYFHTKAGEQAAYLLGMNHLDQGNTYATQRCLQRLLKYGSSQDNYEPELSLILAGCQYRLDDSDGATETLTQLREKTKRDYVEFQGRRISFFEKTLQAREWHAQNFNMQMFRPELPADVWLLARGDSRQNAISDPLAPVSLSNWRVRTVDTADFDDVTRANGMIRFMQDMIDKSLVEGTPRLPAFRPLLVGDTAIIRAFGPLKAFDVKTGKQLWQTVTADEEFNYLVENMYQTPDVQPGKYQAWDLFVTYRAWKDATTGSISSDGRRVFAIHDVGIPKGMPTTVQVSAYRHPLLPGEDNLLRAYDLTTGRFLWEVGGQRGDVQLDLAGTFFLGPPVSYEGKLYVLGDDSREVRLVCLNPETGEPEWIQPLAATIQSIAQTPDRRLLGLTPSVSQGTIICPTGTGLVIAVDPDQAALLWKFSLLPKQDLTAIASRQRFIINRGFGRTAQKTNPVRIDQNWVDSSIVASDKYVAIVSAMGDTLHVLDSTTGKSVWKEPRRRGHGLFLAGMDDEKVIVVGKNFIEGVSILDGTDAWPAVPINQPTGRGIRTGHLFHQPVLNGNEKNSGAIVTIDLRSGRILTRSEIPDNGIAGNLAASKGVVISASPVDLYAFRSVDSLQYHLTDGGQAEDPDALTLRGAIELHLGNEKKAMTLLRESYAKSKSPQAARLIAGALLEGLRTDFTAYESNAGELRGLLGNPDQIATFLRIYADGLRKAGRVQEAFDLHYDFVSSRKVGRSLERINGKRVVRIDRWVSNEIRELLKQASPKQKDAFNTSIRQLYADAKADPTSGRLHDFLDLFSWHPLSGAARWELVDRLENNPDDLEYRRQLAWLSRNGPVDYSYRATLARVENELQERQFSSAVRRVKAFEQTASKAKAPVERKQASELLAEFRETSDLIDIAEMREASIRESDYRSQELPRSNSRPTYYPIQMLHRYEPKFESVQLSIDTRSRRLIAHDEYGKQLWNLALPGLGYYGSYLSYYSHSKGDLFAVALMGRVFMIRGGNATRNPKLLWDRSLRDEFAPANTSVRAEPVTANGNPPGLRLNNNGPYIGKVSAFGEKMICYQSGTELHAVDYITGKKLWTYENAPEGANLMISEDHVFATAPRLGRQVVLNASDGSVVEQRLSSMRDGVDYVQNGYRYFIKEYQGGKFYITSYQPVPGKTDEVINRTEFKQGSFSKRLNGNTLLVVEGGTTVHLFDPFSGEKQFTHKIKAGEHLPTVQPLIKTTLECFDDYNHVYLMIQVHDPDLQAKIKGVTISSMHRYGKFKMIRGPVICLDRKTGQEKWRMKVENDAFLTESPESLPFLVFATNTYQYIARPNSSSRVRKQSAKYLLINKFTGKPVFDKTHNTRDYLYSYNVDLNEGHFDLRFSQRTIRVAMQGEIIAWPDEIPPAPEMPSPVPGTVRRVTPFPTQRPVQIRLR